MLRHQLAFIVIFVLKEKVIFYVEKKGPRKAGRQSGEIKGVKKYDITLHVSCCFPKKKEHPHRRKLGG